MEVIGRLKHTCKYPSCKNSYYLNCDTNKQFFVFPRNPTFHNLWKEACNVGADVNCRYWKICEDHFESHNFVNDLKNRLKRNAVPLYCNRNISNEIGTVTDHDHFQSNNFPISNQCTCLEQPSASGTILTCTCNHSLQSSVAPTGSSIAQEHNYFQVEVENINESNHDPFAFLNESKSEIGLSQIELTPTRKHMYMVHKMVTSKLFKLRNTLHDTRDKLNSLETLYKDQRFDFIEKNLNNVTREFIESQLRNADKKPNARRFTEGENAFALSLYKRSPRLYKYLQVYFQLPSPRTLKAILSKIPFDTGVNKVMLEHLKGQIKNKEPLDCYCTLMFDEISLSQRFHYEHHKQKMSGYEDLGSLGRTSRPANHALVFMARGIREQWKQVVAYYFTSSTISTQHLVFLIQEIICELQSIGLAIVATICDQGPTNQGALNLLCAKPHPRQSPYYFFVNDQPIVTIFDVPHLLKHTRNALLKYKIQFEPHKFAKFQFIEHAFNFDQRKSFKSLPRLKNEHFNVNDSSVKMIVKVAAAQLSTSVASFIETCVILKELPAEAIHTAEFVQKIDDLFDSLNGAKFEPHELKKYKCALSDNSPHLEFWTKILPELTHWKLIDLNTGVDCTKQVSFISGWQTTIKSIIFLWNNIKNFNGFKYLNLRGLNQDPVENLFSSIRQHGAANTNPTCHQFTAALKTVVLNKLVLPVGQANCKNDKCTPLDDLKFLMKYSEEENEQALQSDSDVFVNVNFCNCAP